METTAKERRRFFHAWTFWLGGYFPSIPSDLQGVQPPVQIALLAAFAAHVRNGGVLNRKQKVHAQTVAVALRAISTTIQLDGKPSPLVGKEGKYPKAIQQLLAGYKHANPPTKPKLAIPVGIPNWMWIQHQNHRLAPERHKCIRDFGLIAFYFLLQVGEYTYHRPLERRQTIQFRLQNVTFWHNTTRLSPDLPLQKLYNACTAATLNISNQKNGIKVQSVHQEAINSRFCPI